MWKLGDEGQGSKVVLPASLVIVTALQVLTLNVSAAVVRPGKLDTVLIHTPADASFSAA